jgi:hypothetical protein
VANEIDASVGAEADVVVVFIGGLTMFTVPGCGGVLLCRLIISEVATLVT